MKLNQVLDQSVLWSLGVASLLCATAVAVFNPEVVSFRAFNVAEFVQSLMPLVMFALFIERALEGATRSLPARRSA